LDEENDKSLSEPFYTIYLGNHNIVLTYDIHSVVSDSHTHGSFKQGVFQPKHKSQSILCERCEW